MAGQRDSTDYITALLSHDISNHNQTSRGYLEMLLADQLGPLNEDQARALTVCLRQTTRVQNLIDSVRLLVKLDSTPVGAQRVDLDRSVEAASTACRTSSWTARCA